MNNWIDVNEKLPDEDVEVLCSCGDDVFIASQHNSFFHGYFHDLICVTHWQPLPAPPTK
jgi:hypothetical protein